MAKKGVTMPTLTLHKVVSTGIAGMFETVSFSGPMLDAGYLMLDIQECSSNEIQKHPVSSNQDQPILAMVFVAPDYLNIQLSAIMGLPIPRDVT